MHSQEGSDNLTRMQLKYIETALGNRIPLKVQSKKAVVQAIMKKPSDRGVLGKAVATWWQAERAGTKLPRTLPERIQAMIDYVGAMD